MAWLQENGSTLFWIALFVLFINRGMILARVFGVENISVHDLSARLASDQPPLLLDVRTPMEYASGHPPNAILIPVQDLHGRLDEVRKKCTVGGVAVICRTGNRSLSAAITLKRGGIDGVFNVSGGLVQWRRQGYAVKT